MRDVHIPGSLRTAAPNSSLAERPPQVHALNVHHGHTRAGQRLRTQSVSPAWVAGIQEPLLPRAPISAKLPPGAAGTRAGALIRHTSIAAKPLVTGCRHGLLGGGAVMPARPRLFSRACCPGRRAGIVLSFSAQRPRHRRLCSGSGATLVTSFFFFFKRFVTVILLSHTNRTDKCVFCLLNNIRIKPV